MRHSLLNPCDGKQDEEDEDQAKQTQKHAGEMTGKRYLAAAGASLGHTAGTTTGNAPKLNTIVLPDLDRRYKYTYRVH